MKKTLEILIATTAIIVWSLASASAQTPTTPTDPKTAKKIAELQNQLAILQATLPVVKLEGDIKVAEATTIAQVDRIIHAPKEERKDADKKRNPGNGCSWFWGCPVYNIGYGGGYYGGSYDGRSSSGYGSSGWRYGTNNGSYNPPPTQQGAPGAPQPWLYNGTGAYNPPATQQSAPGAPTPWTYNGNGSYNPPPTPTPTPGPPTPWTYNGNGSYNPPPTVVTGYDYLGRPIIK